MILSVATPCGNAERIPEATMVSKEDEVAPCFLIKNSSSLETSSSVIPGRIKFKICVNADLQCLPLPLIS